MKFWPKRYSQEERNQYLFTLLNDRFERQYSGEVFWRQLHALDSMLKPGCIFMENFTGAPARHLATDDDTSHAFLQDSPNLIMRLPKRNAAIVGARLLNKVFDGSGTKFVPEETVANGELVYQIRSNIDKAHFEKLSVFCSYCFDREITDPDQKKKFQAECQSALDQYTRGTDSEGWLAIKGVPAFVAAMGLHGNLRPKDKHKPDVVRKEAELNAPHPRGTPYLYADIILHADLDKSGAIRTKVSPYVIGFDPARMALMEANEGKPYWHPLVESFGGNPFEKSTVSNRLIRSIGLGLGITGMTHFTHDLIAFGGPLVALTVGGTFFLFTIADHKLKIIDRIEMYRARHKDGKEGPEPRRRPRLVVPHKEKPVEPEVTAAILHNVYTGGRAHEEEELMQVLSGDGAHQLSEAVAREIARQGGSMPKNFEAKIKSAAAKRVHGRHE